MTIHRPRDARSPSALPVRLLACDIDGTLLDDQGSLRPEVRDAIARVRESGVEVVLATGRSPWYGVAELARELGLDGPQVTMQGALIVDAETGEVHRARPLPASLYRATLAFARASGLDPVVAVQDGHRAERRHDSDDDFVAPVVETHFRHVDDLGAVESEGPVRIYLPTPIERHGALLDAALRTIGDRGSIVRSNDSGFEILAPGTNKGDAVAWLAEVRGIGLDQVAAVGDAENDIELLSAAGRSAAMANAPAAVRASASIVVPTSAELGILHALAWFLPDLAPALLGAPVSEASAAMPSVEAAVT